MLSLRLLLLLYMCVWDAPILCVGCSYVCVGCSYFLLITPRDSYLLSLPLIKHAMERVRTYCSLLCIYTMAIIFCINIHLFHCALSTTVPLFHYLGFFIFAGTCLYGWGISETPVLCAAVALSWMTAYHDIVTSPLVKHATSTVTIDYP